MALAAQSRAVASSFFEVFEITLRHTPQSVGLFWTSDQPVAEKNIHASGGIRTHNLSGRAAADLSLRPRGYWDRRHIIYITRSSKIDACISLS